MAIDSDTLYWLLSALIQSFATILSIVGFFIVHWIQLKQKILEEKERDFRGFALEKLDGTRENILNCSKTRLFHLLEMRAAKIEHEGQAIVTNRIREEIKDFIKQITDIEKRIQKIKQKAKWPLIFIGLALILWIICLGFSKSLMIEGLAPYVLILSMLLAIILLVFVIKLIISAIK